MGVVSLELYYYVFFINFHVFYATFGSKSLWNKQQ